ncbi:hypothetical protein PR202_ga23429 [Eleusine coracana subsp. coracana]|uniref:Uncharacterized protein n=1 Tax=Eleusine coracana subsp. coracana TaxID=191504 RepID=A0AAV5D5U2_ELECO|nr:hypothetical protein PR202_ga23429 [Eleusine coracana subsp. coracana]
MAPNAEHERRGRQSGLGADDPYHEAGREHHRILFAEAGKDVVDFLFGVLAMPVGALASMLLAAGDDAALGGVGSLYASVEKIDSAYMQDPSTRDQLAVNTSLPSAPSVPMVPNPNTCSCSTCMPGHAFHAPPPPPAAPVRFPFPGYAAAAAAAACSHRRQRTTSGGTVR